MPTSREAGAKVIVHDSATRADPDQDSVHVPPGLVTYVGVRLVNITRLAAPYPDKCSDDWQDMSYETYSSQICLKLCLQSYTIKHCKCWSSSSPPPQTEVFQCDTRKNKSNYRLFNINWLSIDCIDSSGGVYGRDTSDVLQAANKLQLSAPLYWTKFREVCLHRQRTASMFGPLVAQ